MKQKDWPFWIARNHKLYSDYILTVGTRVRDIWGYEGVITEIDDWSQHGRLDTENHGSITTLRDDGTEDHYVLFEWQNFMRPIIIKQ